MPSVGGRPLLAIGIHARWRGDGRIGPRRMSNGCWPIPSAATRAEMAVKLAGQFEAGALSQSERQIAEEIFRTLTRDAATRVRRALADHLKESRELPHDVALALARDIEDVAVPMLEHSAVLTEADLVEIARSGGPGKQLRSRAANRCRRVVAEASSTVRTGGRGATRRQ